MAFATTPLKPGFAAEIDGIDAGQASDDGIAAITAAMREYAVLVLPGQTLSEEQQVGFAERFGKLDTYPEASGGYQRGIREGLLPVSNSNEDGAPTSLGDRRRLLDIGNKLWHTDSSFKPVPAHLSMLYGVRVASEGGETQFADMRAGYDALSAEWKALIENLVAEHSVLHSRVMLGFEDWDAGRRAALDKWVVHDLVRILPETGRRTLYLSSHAGRIVGMPVPVGRMVLHELTELATAPEHVYTHRWRQNDLVIWDNRCTMHRLRRYRAAADLRVMRRATTIDPAFPARDPGQIFVPADLVEAIA